jgi:putative ABC transport system permease protein
MSRPLDLLALTRSRLRPLDLLREAWLSVVVQPGRSMLTAIGIVLGTAAFVATLGVSSTLSHQVSATFDVRRATQVVIQPVDDGQDTGDPTDRSTAAPDWQSDHAVDRLRRLNGVTDAGPRLKLPEQPVRRAAATGGPATKVRVTGAGPGALDVIEPRIAWGRSFDDFHERTAAAVALLPRTLAGTLGITRPGVAVFIADRAFTVTGIFDDVVREPGTLAGIVVPFSTAHGLATTSKTGAGTFDLLVEVAPGAATLIGDQAPYALAPEAPSRLESLAPPDPSTLRREVEGNVVTMAVILSLVALAMGSVSIGNAASAGIAARTPEIGLRRAVGASPRHIFGQLLAETTTLGALGGLLGAAAGIVVVVVVSLGNGWLPVVDVRTAMAGAGAGIVTGLLAGLAPAARATRIQPVAALQR